MMLQAVLSARTRVLVEVNVPADRLDAVVAVLPAMKSPTIQPLFGGQGYAVKAAVPRAQLPRVVMDLKAAGATDLIAVRPRAGDPVTVPIPVPDVQRLAPYTVHTAGRRGMLRLDFNEHTIGPSPRVLDRLAAISGEDLALYPDESGARTAVRRHFGFDDVVDFVLTSGADEGIRLVCDGYVQAGERVVMLDPGYAMYRFYATLAGADIRPVTVLDDSVSPPEACSLNWPSARDSSSSATRTTRREPPCRTASSSTSPRISRTP